MNLRIVQRGESQKTPTLYRLSSCKPKEPASRPEIVLQCDACLRPKVCKEDDVSRRAVANGYEVARFVCSECRIEIDEAKYM